MLNLACSSAELAVANIYEKIGFNPDEEVLDTEKADATFATITTMCSVLIGKLITHTDASDTPKVCDRIISDAIGMVQSSKLALEQLRKKQAESGSLPIIGQEGT